MGLPRTGFTLYAKPLNRVFISAVHSNVPEGINATFSIPSLIQVILTLLSYWPHKPLCNWFSLSQELNIFTES